MSKESEKHMIEAVPVVSEISPFLFSRKKYHILSTSKTVYCNAGTVADSVIVEAALLDSPIVCESCLEQYRKSHNKGETK